MSVKNVQYIRTGGYYGNVNHPIAMVIQSVEMLNTHVNEYGDRYNHATKLDFYSDTPISFAEAIEGYNNSFFAGNYLVIVMLKEISGSIYHRVDRIDNDRNIHISRLIPEVTTSDIADWSIIIEIEKPAFNYGPFTVNTSREVAIVDTPTMTILGENPVILHVNSSTPYIERGVLAIDGDEENISSRVEIHNELVRNQAGVYFVNYRVDGKFGEEATARREVQVIAPVSEKPVRTPYGFSGQGKQGMKVTHANVVAGNSGLMDLRLSNIDRNMTISIQLVDSVTRGVVVEDIFSAAGTKQYRVNAGRYDLVVTIDKAVGNSKYTINLLMPEVIEYQFTNKEVY